MTRDIEREAEEYAKRNMVVDDQGNTDQHEQIDAYLAGAKAERGWWANLWREYVRLCQLPKDMSQEEIYKGRAAIMDELDQAAGEVK